jgi:enoyl-CoA hydratase
MQLWDVRKRQGGRAMAYEYILSERLDGVALITLNRPEKLNALSFPLMQELGEALTGFEADDDIKAVILTAATSAGTSPATRNR